jgi:hypothetical protein
LLTPSSQVGSATGGLAQPVSREYVALQILVDNAVQQAAKRRAQLRTLPDPFKRTKRHRRPARRRLCPTTSRRF